MTVRHHVRSALFVLGITVCLGGVAAPAAAASRAQYEATMRCYVVASVAADRLTERGETERAKGYEHKAEVAFNLALKIGRDLGIADPVINRDIKHTQYTELPNLLYETGYFAKAAAACRAKGLM